jgi:hypothetical protein
LDYTITQVIRPMYIVIKGRQQNSLLIFYNE